MAPSLFRALCILERLLDEAERDIRAGSVSDARIGLEAIRKRRRELGCTQAELASFCDCSTVYLSNLENGKETAEIGKALFIKIKAP